MLLLFLFISVSTYQTKHLMLREKKSYFDIAVKLLNDNYVFPDVALKITKHLKLQRTKGGFDKITTIQDFAAKLTIEMQSVSKDKHMRCRPVIENVFPTVPVRPIYTISKFYSF